MFLGLIVGGAGCLVYHSKFKIPEGYIQDEKDIYVKKEEGEARYATSKDITELSLPALFGSIQPKPHFNKRGDHHRLIGYFPITGFYTGAVEIANALQMVYSRVILGDNQVEDLTGSKLWPEPGILRDMLKLQSFLKIVYSRVILRNNREEDSIDSKQRSESNILGEIVKISKDVQTNPAYSGLVTLETRAVVKVNLSAMQKMSIVAKSILLCVRGVITFCQLGIVFAPFDVATNWYYKEG